VQTQKTQPITRGCMKGLAEAQLPPRAQRAGQLFAPQAYFFWAVCGKSEVARVLELRASTQRLPSFSLLQWPFFCGEDPYLSTKKGHVRRQGGSPFGSRGTTSSGAFDISALLRESALDGPRHRRNTRDLLPIRPGGLDRANTQDAAVSSDSLPLFSVPFLSSVIALI
jgi:hypothetical protein